MNDKEKYLFDLQGFLVVKDVLDEKQLTALNQAIDEKETAGDQLAGFFEWESSCFRDLINDAKMIPYMTEILEAGYRLDHEYLIVHEKGDRQLHLHGGGTPYDPGQFYHFRNGKMFSGLTVVSYALRDLGPDDGGFCCVPGSHKSNYRLPKDFGHYEELGPTVHIPQKAGDVLIFTEALTHGTFAWQGAHKRRSLLLKYSPSAISWSSYKRTDQLMATLTEEQRKILAAPCNAYTKNNKYYDE